MTEKKCPDCPHPLKEHTRWIGCRHQKRNTRGELEICSCTRVEVK